MIRELTIEDLPTASAMVGLKPRTSGTVPISQDDFIKNFNVYFSGSTKTKAFGYFDNDQLVCFVCVGFFESKMRGRFWVIPALYTRNFKQVFNFKDPDMALLLKYTFEFAENNEYYEFYYSVAERIMNAYERQWQRNSVMPIGRYDLITLDQVPAFTKPEFELYWRLMGEETKPDTIVIKKRVLKEQYRKTKIVLYTPLDIPRIEPNNWDEWWDIWNTYAGSATKKIETHNSYESIWKSLEIYRYTESSPIIDSIVYECPRCPQTPVIQDLINQIQESYPGIVRYIRVIENQSNIKFHSDADVPQHQFRTLLWTTNDKLNWLFKRNEEVFFPKLPKDSNTFYYYDYHTQHCAPYSSEISKGILQAFISFDSESDDLIERSSKKYENLAWVIHDK
jgi:hypothetical protein